MFNIKAKGHYNQSTEFKPISGSHTSGVRSAEMCLNSDDALYLTFQCFFLL